MPDKHDWQAWSVRAGAHRDQCGVAKGMLNTKQTKPGFVQEY